MRRATRVLWAAAMVATMACHPSFAVDYVIVNNGNSIANSATLYRLNTKVGKLAKVATLYAGGQAAGGEVYVGHIEQAVSAHAGCIFVFNDGSSDIAAFSKATSYRRVGRYFNADLIAGQYGGTLALSPGDQFLYASYAETGNIGVWTVKPDCTLALSSIYSDEHGVGPIAITPNGKYLVESSAQGSIALFRINRRNGGLTMLTSTGFETGVCARVGHCMPLGLDITKDSTLVVSAASSTDVTHQHDIPVALTARITPNGLMNPRSWPLKNSVNLAGATFPFFGASGYAGAGNLYFGVKSGGGYGAGVLTTNFTENPLKLNLSAANTIDPDVADIAVTGNVMVVAQPPDQISVFRIQKDGSLKLLSTTIDKQAGGLFSLSIFPNTR